MNKSAVKLDHVSKSFGGIKAVDNISLEVNPGEIVAILGPNGAGKTTAISLMLGLRKPDSGSANLFGRNPQNPSAREHVGVMLQESDFPAGIKVSELVEMVGKYYPTRLATQEAISRAGLESKSHVVASTLSGGQKKRLSFALSIVGNPDILFLDEPTAALDVEARRDFWSQVSDFSKSGKTVILTTHYLEEADTLAERIVVINQGQVVAEGSPAQIKARVGGKVIRFHSSSLPPLENISGFQRLQKNGDMYEVFTSSAEQSLREIFQIAKISDLEIRSTGLEEAFVELTSQKNGGAA